MEGESRLGGGEGRVVLLKGTLWLSSAGNENTLVMDACMRWSCSMLRKDERQSLVHESSEAVEYEVRATSFIFEETVE